MRTPSICTTLCLTTALLFFSYSAPAQGQSNVADTPTPPSQSLTELHLQKEPLRASLLNLIPFGVGSFQQGDPIASTGLLISDLLSTGVITYAFLSAHTRSYDQNMMLVGWGAAGLAGGRLAGVIAPSLHYRDALSQYQAAGGGLSFVSYQVSF